MTTALSRDLHAHIISLQAQIVITLDCTEVLVTGSSSFRTRLPEILRNFEDAPRVLLY